MIVVTTTCENVSDLDAILMGRHSPNRAVSHPHGYNIF